MKEEDIIKAYCKIRTIDHTIPDDVLDFMKQASIEKLRQISDIDSLLSETHKIVISSSWRKSHLNTMKEMWEFRNLPGEVIDVTPSCYLQRGGGIQFWNNKLEQHPTPKVHGYSIPRGCEIDYWLKNEAYHFDSIESYVILDDDTDMLLKQKDNFVQCSGNSDDEDCVDCGWGLTTNCTNKAIEILNRKDNNNVT
jgi:hypothetical protein